MSHGRGKLCLIGLWHFLFLVGTTGLAMAQGTLGDYQRAQRFLPGNVRQLSYIAVVTPNWIEKTNRFWYLKSTAQGSQFILVDADKNTSGPAFDQAKLANALSTAAKRTVKLRNCHSLPSNLPMLARPFILPSTTTRGLATCRITPVPHSQTQKKVPTNACLPTHAGQLMLKITICSCVTPPPARFCN